jgi:hypothetical protein
MGSAYEELRTKVASKLQQRDSIRDELHQIPGLVADHLATHIGAPRKDILVGHFGPEKEFVADVYEEHPQRIAFSVMLDFNLGEDEDFRIPVAVEAVLHADGYRVHLDGDDIAGLGSPPATAADAGAAFAAISGELATRLFGNVDKYLLK